VGRARITQETIGQSQPTENISTLQRTLIRPFSKSSCAFFLSSSDELASQCIAGIPCLINSSLNCFECSIFTAKQTIHTFEHGNTKTFDSSKVKRNIIQNSIYGVDIEKGAVDIARLRFWLSLIVDEETPKALLNLDYKIVVGNSLVSKFGENIIDIDWTLNETSHGFFGADLAKQKGNILKKISNEQKEFFNPESDKKKLAADIRNLKIDLLITQLELMVKTKGIEVEPKGTGKKIKEQIEIYLQTLGWLKSIKELKELKNKPELPLHFFDWKLDFPEVMNPLVYENNSSKIVVANAQILALNVQIDAINKHLLNSNIDSHLIHLQANIAQSQVEIIKEQLLILEKTIKDIFGIINPIDDNIVNEPDLSFTYKIASINKGIEGINQQIDNINLQIDKQNPNIGFDIVIGNPPYVLFNDISLIQNFKEKYKTANNGKINLYKIFIEKGIDLLKNVGLLYFINPNTYLSSKDSKILRELIINNTAIIEIIEFTEKDKVFENVAQAVTILGLKKEKVKNHIFKIKTAKQGLNYINQNDLRNLKDYHFISINKTISSILKTENNLNDFCEVFQGEINLTVKRDFFSENQSENKLPMLRGNNVGKYELVGNINEFCEIIADNRGHYKNERIVTQQVSNQSQKFRTKSLLIERNILCGNSTNYIILKESVHDCKLKFILALINSLTFNYYFNFFSSTNHLTCEELLFIPTPKASISIQNKIIKIVDKIHFIKSSNKDSVTSLEQEIDNIVYKLYELTYEEVKVIDPNFGLSEEEYKKLQIE
jgi:Alw26I/Eco31I/Esp3I family type II restriction m6 adenine DNA methyltransferase